MAFFQRAYDKTVVKVSEMQDLIKKEIKMETGNRSATGVIAKWQKTAFDLLTQHDFTAMPDLHPKEFIGALQDTILPQDLRAFVKSEYLGSFKPHNKDVATFFTKVEFELENRLKFVRHNAGTDADNARQVKALQEEIRALRAVAGTGGPVVGTTAPGNYQRSRARHSNLHTRNPESFGDGQGGKKTGWQSSRLPEPRV